MKVNDFVLLLVEDDPDQIFLFKRALEKAHLVNPVHIAVDGDMAIRYLSGEGEFADRQRHPLPSLMLLDLKLPKIPGIQVLEWVRAHPVLKDLPVVVLTNSVDPRDVKRVTELGVSSYLGKPVDFVGLLEMMKTVGMYWMILHPNPEAQGVAAPVPAGATTADAAGILLVDQDQDFAEAVAQSLRRRLPGVGVDAVLDPAEALQRLESGSYRVLVLNQDTSLAASRDYLRKVSKVRSELPVVLLLDEHQAEPSEKGVAALLQKSSQFGSFCGQLQESIAGLLKLEEDRKAPSQPPPPKPIADRESTARAPRQDTEILGQVVHFQKTSWDLVHSARNVQAMDSLIRIYWKPLYFFVRQKGNDNETSKDIVQEFLTGALERGTILKADPARGKFRTFLLAALENFMTDRARTAGRLKRGGGQAILSLDFEQGEKEFGSEVASDEKPEAVMDQAWAKSLLQQSMAELKGSPAHLKAFELLMQGADYDAIAAETGLSRLAVKTAVFRLRQQLKDILTAHLTEEGASDEEVARSISEFLSLLTSQEGSQVS